MIHTQMMIGVLSVGGIELVYRLPRFRILSQIHFGARFTGLLKHYLNSKTVLSGAVLLLKGQCGQKVLIHGVRFHVSVVKLQVTISFCYTFCKSSTSAVFLKKKKKGKCKKQTFLMTD